MSDSNTTNLGLVLPEPFGSDGTWGAKINSNFVVIDTNIGIVANNVVNVQNSVLAVNSSLSANISSLSSNVFSNIPSTFEAQTGANNSKFMTPLRNREAGIGRPHARIGDVKPSGTNGQASITSTWMQVNINTEVFDPFELVSISSNSFTVSENVWALAKLTCYAINPVRTRMWNVTDNVLVALSNNGYGHPSYSSTPYLEIGCDLVAGKTYRVDFYATNTICYTGLANGIGVQEQYLTIDLWRS